VSLTLEQRQARAFLYMCARPGRIDFMACDDGGYIGWWGGPTPIEDCTASSALEAVEAVVARIRATFDPQWGLDCEPEPDRHSLDSLEGVQWAP